MTLKKYLASVRDNIVPKAFPRRVSFQQKMYYREVCTTRGMWAVVDMKWTKALAKYIGDRKVLEIMAGAGWLAKALSLHGVDIIATDNCSWEGNGRTHSNVSRGEGEVFPVVRMDGSDAVEAFADAEILLVSWPPYGGKDILEHLNAWGGERPIIYIGHGIDGCCACDAFFNGYARDKRVKIPNPSWPGENDSVNVGYWRP